MRGPSVRVARGCGKLRALFMTKSSTKHSISRTRSRLRPGEGNEFRGSLETGTCFSLSCSVSTSPAAPLGGIRQHKQVHTGKELQGEHEHRHEAKSRAIPPLYHGHAVDDDGHRKGNGQPAVGLPNPFIPVHLGPLLDYGF